jgi:hypothetical protein
MRLLPPTAGAIEHLTALQPCDKMGFLHPDGAVMASSEGWHVDERRRRAHLHRHAFAHLDPLGREGLIVASRRNLLKAGLAGLDVLSLPGLLCQRASAAESGRPIGGSIPSGPRLATRRCRGAGRPERCRMGSDRVTSSLDERGLSP